MRIATKEKGAPTGGAKIGKAGVSSGLEWEESGWVRTPCETKME